MSALCQLVRVQSRGHISINLVDILLSRELLVTGSSRTLLPDLWQVGEFPRLAHPHRQTILQPQILKIDSWSLQALITPLVEDKFGYAAIVAMLWLLLLSNAFLAGSENHRAQTHAFREPLFSTPGRVSKSTGWFQVSGHAVQQPIPGSRVREPLVRNATDHGSSEPLPATP